MRFLITGSAGFVGSHLVDRLLGDGHQVIGVDSYLSGQRQHTAALVDHPSFSFIEADVSYGIPYDGDRLDWVLHFASPASPPHYQQYPIETLRVGAHGTEVGLELARRHDAGFFLASTSEVYGDPQVHPQAEDYWGHVNPNGVRSCYDEAKRFAEALVMAYHRHHGVNTRIIRIFNTYGPRMRADDGRVVTNFINQALQGGPLTIYGNGSQTRSFQYVDDLVEGVMRVMGVRHAGPINLGNPVETTVYDFADLVRNLIDPRLEIVHLPAATDDPQRRRPDIALAERILDWRPLVSVREGLERTIAYFRPSVGVPVPDRQDRAAASTSSRSASPAFQRIGT